MVLLSPCLLCNIVSEFTGNTIVSGSGGKLVERDIAALLCGAETSSEAVGAIGEAVASFGRDVLIGGHIVGPWTW